jgi:hypothetical protein
MGGAQSTHGKYKKLLLNIFVNTRALVRGTSREEFVRMQVGFISFSLESGDSFVQREY